MLTVAPAEIASIAGCNRHRPERSKTTRGRALQHVRTELRQLQRRLADSDRRQHDVQQFVAMLAQDLRTPLLALEGCLDLLASHAASRRDPVEAQLLHLLRGGIDRLRDMNTALATGEESDLEHPQLEFEFSPAARPGEAAGDRG